MPPRLYKRHCSTCGISHTKPTGRKCTRSTMATDTNALATSTITGGHVLNSASMSSSLASLTSVAPTAVGSPLSLTTPRPSLGTLTSTTTSLTFSSSSLLTPSRPGPLSSTVSFRLPAPLMSTHTSTPPPYHPLIQTPQPSADQLALHSTLQVVTSVLDQISLRMTNMENREAQRQASQVGSPPAATAVRTVEGATGGRPAPPDPSDARVAALVQEQLQRLGMECSSDSEDERDGTTIQHSKCRKLKSGRGRTTKDFVVKEVAWPHLGVYKGPERQAAEYDTLTVPEFVAGYVGTIVNSDHTLQEETSARLHHLRELMLDAAAYPWPNIRNYHAIVLTEMEHDRLSWSNRSTIQDLRAQYARVNELNTPDQATRTNHRSSLGRSKPCYNYQRGQCKHTGDHHTTRGDTVIHACAWCLRVRGKTYVHPEKDCRTKVESTSDSKNDATVTGGSG